jgi:hypothetical protein
MPILIPHQLYVPLISGSVVLNGGIILGGDSAVLLLLQTEPWVRLRPGLILHCCSMLRINPTGPIVCDRRPSGRHLTCGF